MLEAKIMLLINPGIDLPSQHVRKERHRQRDAMLTQAICGSGMDVAAHSTEETTMLHINTLTTMLNMFEA